MNVNVEMIKTLVSGGDNIEARRMRENEITIQNNAFVMILANDMPKTNGDEAYVNRNLVVYAPRSSTTNEEFDEHLYFKADTTIKEWIDTESACNGLIKLLCDYYTKHKNNRTPVPEWVKVAVQENIVSSSSFEWVKDNYNVYDGNVLKDFDGEVGSTNHYRFNWDKVGDNMVRFDMMYKIYADSGGKDSSTKFGRMLTDNGIYTAIKKIKGKATVYRIGLSLAKEDEENSDDEI